MTTFSKPEKMIVFVDGQQRVEECDGYDLISQFYDGQRNRCVIQPVRYLDRSAPGNRYFAVEPFGEDYAISCNHPLCPSI